MTVIREYIGHSARVTGIVFALNCEWVLSIGRDKMFQFHNTANGKRLGTYQAEAWYTALEYPF